MVQGLVCACDRMIFASITPFSAAPACPPTQHMSPAPPLADSSSLILLIISYSVVSCGLRSWWSLLCSVLAECDVFISINTHAFTLQPNYDQRDFLFFPGFFYCPVCSSKVKGGTGLNQIHTRGLISDPIYDLIWRKMTLDAPEWLSDYTDWRCNMNNMKLQAKIQPL